jgi:hypothetical protein
MTCKTYIGIPHRQSGSGQPVVTVCDGQKSEPLPLRLDLFNHSPAGFSWGTGEADRLSWPLPFLPMRSATTTWPSACTRPSNSGSWLVGRKGRGGGSRPTRSRPS